MADRLLTPTEVDILRAADSGRLWFSGRGHSLYQTFADGKKVTALVSRIAQREVRLIELGGGSRDLERTWQLTEAGRAELAKHPEES